MAGKTTRALQWSSRTGTSPGSRPARTVGGWLQPRTRCRCQSVKRRPRAPTRLQLRRLAVLAGVQLSNRRVEIQGEVRNARRAAEGPGRHHDVLGNDAVSSELEHILPIDGLQPVDAGECSHREGEPFGVRRQVVGDLVLGRDRTIADQGTAALAGR